MSFEAKKKGLEDDLRLISHKESTELIAPLVNKVN